MNATSPLLQELAPCALASWPGAATSRLSRGRFSIRELLACLLLFVAAALAQPAAATTTVAQNGLSCAGARATTSCTAGEFVTTVTITGQSGSCVSGGYYTLTGDVSLTAPNTDRYDIGFFVGENGNAPEASSATATCSVATFPTSPAPWFSSSSNTCGDFKGKQSDTPTIQNMRVYCQADASGNLAVPYVLTYTQDSSGVCTGPSDVQVGNSSKCNKGTASVSGVTVVPAMTKTDNVSSRVMAGTTTSVAYTVGFSNLNAGTLSATFTDPPPSGYTVGSITCSSTPSGNCPAACSSGTCSAAAVTAITQGAGLSISIPAAINSTTPGRMSFVINGSYAASSSPGSFTNTAQGVVNGYSQTASDTITVVAQPTATKAFSQSSILPGGTSKLTITLSNSNSFAISSAAFTDAYPSGLKNAATTNLANSCGGTATAAAGGTSLALSGGTIPANGSCAVSVDVTSNTAGSYTNNTGTISSGNAGSSAGSSATLVVMAPPTATKAFSQSSIAAGGTTNLTITLTNSNAFAISSAAFTDNYPANLKNAATTNLANTCGGTATAGAGGSSLALSGGTIPANGSCAVSVDVTSNTAGSYTNNTGAINSGNAGSSAGSSATLSVMTTPTATKAFSQSSIVSGATSKLTITLSNANASAISSAAFTDNYPSNLKNAATTNLANSCGGTATASAGGASLALSGGTIPGNGSCAVSVDVTSNTAGSYTNNTGTISSGNAGSYAGSSATLIVMAPPAATKAFGLPGIAQGGTTKLTITLSNANAFDISGAAFTDTYPAGLKNAATTNLDNTCGGTATASAGGASLALSGGTIPANGSCAVSVDITGNTAGSYTNNTGTISSGNAGTFAGHSATLVILAPPTVTESFTPSSLPIYSSGCTGCTSIFAVTITNPNSLAIGGAAFSDTYSSTNMVNVGTASWSCTNGTSGTAMTTATDGGSSLGVSSLTIPANGSCTVSITVKGTAGGSYYATNTGSGTVVTTSNAGSATATRATLMVKLVAPTVTKSFSPQIVGDGGLSTLTITLTNPSTTVDISGAGFTDTYPTGMVNNGASSTTCAGATASAPSTTSLQLANATIPMNGSCTVSVQVKATATGNNSLPAGAVTSTNAEASGSTVSATLYVAKTLVLTASPSTVPNDGSTQSVITATITDTTGAAVPGDAVTLICTGSALPNSQAATTGAGGQAGFAITDTQMETVSCTATDSTGLSASVSVTFSSVGGFNAFETATAANATSGSIYTKLAGTAFSLDVVAIAGSSQASSFSGNVKLELLANTGTAGSGYGTDNCPTSATVVQTIASTALAGGRSTVSFAAVDNAYQDVRVRISYLAAAPPIVICSIDNFAIRPAGLVLWTDAYAGWTSTPATATGALGRSDQVTAFAPLEAATPVIKAGRDFKLYATTTTGTNYSGTLTVDSSKLTAQKTSQATSQEDGGVVGTLTTSLTTNNQTAANLAANSGIGANATYSEVGYVYLAAGAYRDNTFTSVDGSSDCVADSISDTLAGGKYGCLIGNTDIVRLGRFIPDHFELTGSVQPRSDVAAGSTFTYMDEPMKFTLSVTAYRYVAAHAAAPSTGVTQNYAGKFAKLDAATLCNSNLAACGDSGNYGNWFAAGCAAGSQCMGLGAVSGSTALTTRLALDIATTGSAQPTSAWSAGVGTFTANVVFKRDTAPDGPYSTLKIGGKPLDSDGVTLPPLNSPDTAHCVDLDVKTGTQEAACAPGATETDLRRKLFETDIRFGRLRLSNAFGSEKSSLQMQIQAQYWSGKSWVLNAADSLTVLPASAFALSGGLASNTSASAVNLAGGKGVLTLAKPNPSATGSVDVAINLGSSGSDQSCLGSHGGAAASLPWLRFWNGACATSYDRDPSARATFGIYPAESRKTVHVRELY